MWWCPFRHDGVAPVRKSPFRTMGFSTTKTIRCSWGTAIYGNPDLASPAISSRSSDRGFNNGWSWRLHKHPVRVPGSKIGSINQEWFVPTGSLNIACSASPEKGRGFLPIWMGPNFDYLIICYVSRHHLVRWATTMTSPSSKSWFFTSLHHLYLIINSNFIPLYSHKIAGLKDSHIIIPYHPINSHGISIISQSKTVFSDANDRTPLRRCAAAPAAPNSLRRVDDGSVASTMEQFAPRLPASENWARPKHTWSQGDVSVCVIYIYIYLYLFMYLFIHLFFHYFL